tara:strand:- start:791 stop:1090 length:300 start_codon:yes stop_codon:yes gene_type:complete
MLNVKEIFQETVRTETSHHRMVLKKVYSSRDCLVNPDYIVAAYPYKFSSSTDKDMLKGFADADDDFTRIIIDGNSFRSSEMILMISYYDFQKLVKKFKG